MSESAQFWDALRLSMPTVNELFSYQAEKVPSAVAVIDAEETLSYGELAHCSALFAASLVRDMGVRRGDLVAVQMDRSAGLLIALLGILRAGAAYVPIDREAPPARRDLILRQSGVEIVVTEADVNRARKESGDGELDDWLDDQLGGRIAANDVMYVLYTSGTTGTPKGVVLEHGGAANVLTWMVREYGFAAGDRVLQKTPYTFDASVWELFVPLISGGAVVFAEPGGHRDPRYLVEAVRSHRVTTLQLVPSMLRHVLDDPDFASCSTLRHVFCGGEALGRDLRARFHDALRIPLVNLYGPTETSIQVLAWACVPGDERTFVPIGRPVDNVVVSVLDDRRAQVPVGEVGELYVGGIAVARGYLGDAEQTARSFVADPFSDNPADRLYRTGDLVRRHPDGVLEFVGRRDEQVKVNGHRVELGEIETALRRFPGVRDAAVLVAPADHASTRLVAYLRTAVGPERESELPRVPDLRRHLAEHLPEYMVPGQFRVTSEFPYSAHGKLDRAELATCPSTILGASVPLTEYGRGASTGGEVESKLVDIWRRILSVDTVGIHDDFFELGGDSMAGLVMIAHARKLGIVITPNELFRLRRISAIAASHSC